MLCVSTSGESICGEETRMDRLKAGLSLNPRPQTLQIDIRLSTLGDSLSGIRFCPKPLPQHPKHLRRTPHAIIVVYWEYNKALMVTISGAVHPRNIP